jgi:hypothetical protein
MRQHIQDYSGIGDFNNVKTFYLSLTIPFNSG